uniref:1-phosphatidylinositol 4-kinase n=1 Tax=Guillardia theta TaxID=55529 RepID=A0A7S4UU52_GUITH|mmetsp:Transcript_8300/g.27931  ORF Transcript_8300/g.27931 Transcript_8300/m.27931 type:complete len:264 (+) Transcript_8300:588-1379(+)
MQLISCFHSIFRSCKSNLWLRPYQVVSTADDAGLIEVVPDAISLHALRDKWIAMKWAPSEQNLYSYFLKAYGPEHSASYKQAQRNFIESMAAYAVVCYILKVKDRNDGNLMITRAGHLVHIDFGFMLSNTPGDMAFEQAPFKLTSEYVQVMGGKESASFAYFRELCVQGFLEVRRPQNCRKILFLIEMMSSGLGGDLSMPCVAGQATSSLVLSIKEQFMLRRREEEVRDFVHHLVDDSLDNWYTRQYDNYQTLQKTLSNMFFW